MGLWDGIENIDISKLSDEAVILLKSQLDPGWFFESRLNVHFWQKQLDIAESVRDNPRTTVRSCNGIGKSFTAGNLVLWFLYSFPGSIVLTTAPTGRQVEKLIWKEVRASYAKAEGITPLGGNLLPKSPELQIVQEQWYAAGFATNDKTRFQGYHEEYILVIVDEGSGVDADMYEAIEGVLTSDKARLLVLGNPNDPSGYFYNSHREPGWNRIAISAFDTPNFTTFGITEEDFKNNTWFEKIGGRELPNNKLVTPSWAYDKYVRWKPESPAYQVRVAGNFPDLGVDTVIPLSWIQAAQDRWYDMEPTGDVRKIGADIAWYGDDKTVLAPRLGNKVMSLKKYSKQGTTETTGRIILLFNEYKAIDGINIDVGGIGGGVYDQVFDQGLPAFKINFGENAIEDDKYADHRSEMYWNLRELLNPENKNPIGLPPEDDLLGDLSGIKYKIDSRGRIRVESKDDIKKRIGRSPDDGDAVMLAFAAPKPTPGTGMLEYFRKQVESKEKAKKLLNKAGGIING
jgi:hypothetical protein